MAFAHSSVLRLSTCFQEISLFLLWLLLLMGVDAQNQTEEVQTLLRFKASMQLSNGHLKLSESGFEDVGNSGGPWSYWSSWNEAHKDPCDWVGVICTISSTVEALDLSGWGLHELTALSLGILSNLTDLRKLDLSTNYLGTVSPYTIPDTLKTLTGLTRLHLARNYFSGQIPASISACQNLTYISFDDNQLNGTIPYLGSLSKLQVLLLARNRLTGPFPRELGGISGLVNIDISGNMLSGPIPSLPNLTNLLDLNLDNNNFTAFEGPLFPGVKSLEHLSMNGNQLEGTIPPYIGNLTNLKVLDLSSNQLSGKIPFGFSQRMTNSLFLDFSQNQLNGQIPADLLQPNVSENSLVSMNLSNNHFTGNILLDGTRPYYYLFLDLSHNNLSGDVPSFSNNTKISSLCLQNNLLSGDIVDVIGNSPGWLRLTELRLENNLLFGDLARLADFNTSLQFLQSVNLSNNNLQMRTTQGIPNPLRVMMDFFTSGGNLKELWAGGNNFSGTSLPADFGSYTTLEVLDLSNNHLKGGISGEAFSSTWLPSLQFLNLSNNDVIGPVPENIFVLPNLEILDLTNNSLFGPLPIILPSSRLYDPNFFLGNDGLCGGPLPPCPQDLKKGVQWWVFLISVGGSVVVAAGSCLVATWRWRVYHKRHKQDADLIKALLERESTTLMSFWELKKATSNFAMSAQIGEGGFGTVYKGKLNNGTIVAIKRGKHDGSERDKEKFLNEVRILSQVNHRHLVKLLGCCMENKISLLVLEFISNGTLQEHLQGKFGGERLNWEQRLNIAVQTADALNYLHSATTFPIYHRDVKSANILLDDDFNAKVADFGISRLAPIAATHVTTLAIHGTIGYIDPEYYTTYQLNDKSDVYSFGVVLLELISAKPAVDFCRDTDETSLVYFASPHIETGDLQQLVDPVLIETYNDLAGHGRESIFNVGRLAIKCVDMRCKARPSMSEVWKELQRLRLEFAGCTSKVLCSLNEDDNEDGDNIVLFSGHFSQTSSNVNMDNDRNTIQMANLPESI